MRTSPAGNCFKCSSSRLSTLSVIALSPSAPKIVSRRLINLCVRAALASGKIGRVEIVHRDRIQRDRAQFFQQAALIGADPAFLDTLAQLILELQRLDIAVLQRLEELALDRFGQYRLGQRGVDTPGRVMRAGG